MAFDPIIACLQEITDYRQYERFCTDLMRIDGYNGIEPLGGVADKSRDSILLHNGGEIIFHYSVRKDWRAKLWFDAEGVRKNGHKCTKIVCVNPAGFTATERDSCIKAFEAAFGWPLVLYGIERIASMLRTNAASLLHTYPQIFVPRLIESNRVAEVDVRISPTCERRRQLAQIVAYNRGPGPVLIESWYASWQENSSPRLTTSIQCYKGYFPIRLEEKQKLDIIVPLDFEWAGLTKLGLVDAEKHRYDATANNITSFIHIARQHMPPPSRKVNELTYEEITKQPVSIVLRAEEYLGKREERLVLVFRNDGDLPLKTVGAEIEWEFNTERALANEPRTEAPRVVESGASITLQRISQTDTSMNGSEVLFALDKSDLLVDVIVRSSDIVTVKADVHVAPAFKITETENIREVIAKVARSVIDSWDEG